MPAATNPADFALEVCNKDFCSAADVDCVIEAWARRAAQNPPSTAPALPIAMAHATTSFQRQVRVLLRKHALLMVKDPTLYAARATIMLVIGILFPCIYIKTRDLVQDQIIQRLFLMFWIMSLPGVIALSVVFVFSLAAENLRVEVKSGMYSVLAYVTTVTLLELPAMLTHALILLLAVFGVGNWHWSVFGECWLLWALLLWAWEAAAQINSIAPHFIMGLLNYQGFWYIGLVTGGLVLRIHDVIWPFRCVFYITAQFIL